MADRLGEAGVPYGGGDQPLLIAIAGPNGAGKTTFHDVHLADLGLRFVNADRIAGEFALPSADAARVADRVRAQLIAERASFITETVFSDPVQAKLAVFAGAMAAGYHVLLIFIGLASAELSDERVAMRVSQGGHDVPPDRIVARYPRCLANLRAAIPVLSEIEVRDHSDLRRPYRLLARFRSGRPAWRCGDPPAWWRAMA